MTKKALHTGLIHEELEPRLLFSGGLETVLLDDNCLVLKPLLLRRYLKVKPRSCSWNKTSKLTRSQNPPVK